MIRIIFVLTLFATSVCAQDQPTSRERALMDRVSSEVNGSIVCVGNIIALQDKIKELEAKLKAATAEPKKE